MNKNSHVLLERNGKVETDRRKWSQIIVALSICYICISGGNLVGYTSSAIPSIREGKLIPFFHILQQQNCTKVELPQSPLLKISNGTNESLDGLAFRIQDIQNPQGKLTNAPEMSESGNGIDTYKECVEFLQLTDSQASWIGGLAPLGAFFGSMIAPFPIRFFGPKGTILKFGAPAHTLSWFITAFSPSLIYIYIGRIIGGLAMGISFSAVPLYIVETASLKYRGPLGTLCQFLFTIGVLLSFVFGYFFDWRTSALVCGLIVLPSFIILPLIPESPVWLLKQKRVEDAHWSIRRVHGPSHSMSDQSECDCEIQKLYDLKDIQGGNNLTNLDLLDVNRNSKIREIHPQKSSSNLRSNFKSTFVAIFLCIFQQLTGINAVNFYTVTIFESATGPDSFLDGHVSAIIVAVVFCLSNLCSYLLIKKLGRKYILLVSTLFISLASFTLGTYFYILNNLGADFAQNNVTFSIIPLVSLVTFVLAFSIGYGPLLYVIVAEVLPNNIRSVVSPIAVGINWLCVFVVAKTFPGIILSLGASGAFWLYSGFSVVSLIVTVVCVPETKGKTEEEIQDFFRKGNYFCNKN